jgi:hypothetical protein
VAEHCILVAAVGLLAWLSYNFTRLILLSGYSPVSVRRSRSAYDDKFLETRMFKRLAMIVPGVIVYLPGNWMLRENLGWLTFAHKTAALWI